MGIATWTRKSGLMPPGLTESRLEELEGTALEKSARAISAIESAIAVWDLSKDKPKELGDQVMLLRNKHERLAIWIKDMLRAKKGDLGQRAMVLQRFGDIFKGD
jgi:hypothetical protein